jgi:uncharacterized membrane protein
MTAWSALRSGFDAFTKRLPLLLGAWFVILILQQIIDLLIPDAFPLLQTIVTLIVLAPLYAGQQYLALKVVRDEPVTFREFAVGLHRWGPVVGGYVIVTLLTVLGTLLFIIPGIIVAVTYAFVLIRLVDASSSSVPGGVVDAMRDSSRLTRGYRGTLFGIGLLLAIPALVLGAFIWLSVFNPGIPTWLVDVIALLTGTLFLGPVQATSFMVVYDRAVRGATINHSDPEGTLSGLEEEPRPPTEAPTRPSNTHHDTRRASDERYDPSRHPPTFDDPRV